MKLSLVVPAFNEEKILAQTLAQMNRAREGLAARGWTSELIVCDNNSADRTAEVAAQAGATVVFEPVNQIGRARNRGARAATGDWLVFIDADSHPDAALLRDLAEQIESGRWIAGGCLVAMDRAMPWPWALLVRVWNLISRCARLAPGSFLACDARAFRRLDGFDTRFYAGEEIDLSLRLKRLGRKEGRGLFILRRPLVTSARKIELYSGRELGRILLRALLRPGRFKRTRRECGLWYDGRR